MDLSVIARHARLDALETSIGTTPILRLFTGPAPANCATADSGTELVEMNLPSDWMAPASGGSKALSGVWSAAAGADGTPGHYRFYDAGDTTCHMQGTVSGSGGGGELIIDDTTIVTAQTVTVAAFSITAGNA